VFILFSLVVNRSVRYNNEDVVASSQRNPTTPRVIMLKSRAAAASAAKTSDQNLKIKVKPQPFGPIALYAKLGIS
jgi:hypothetical protein